MNKRIRADIAKLMATLAQQYGAQTEIKDESTYREHSVTARWPGKVSVRFDIGSLHNGGILSHWYDAEYDLVVPPFDSVNPHHRRKATMFGVTPHVFADKFERACAAVADGSAFAMETAE